MRWQNHLQERLVVNHLLAFGYIGFWHLSLFWWHWAKRPFVKDRPYQWSKVIHNIFYTWLGILQWTATEVAFIYCFQANRISYRHENLSVDHPMLLLQTFLACVMVPVFRDIHFYFAHRLIHLQFLYKYIHSLHHRNTDIEPFSGLAMHPIEHLYYYTCYAPCLLGGFHPFVVFWMGVHVVISPAASHSGYEDHFSASLSHYLHHRHSDCNFGVQSIPFDHWFGSFRDQLKPGNTSSGFKPTADPKARLGWIPDHSWFNVSWILLWFAACRCYRHPFGPAAGAILVSIGPAVIALNLQLYTNSNGTSMIPNKSIVAPFEKDPFWSKFSHFGLGTGIGVLPATYLIYLTMLE